MAEFVPGAISVAVGGEVVLLDLVEARQLHRNLTAALDLADAVRAADWCDTYWGDDWFSHIGG